MIWRWKDGTGWVETDLFGSAVGMPVIIACNGPSLREMPVEKFCGPGRLVLGVNGVYPRLRPDIWLGMDKPAGFPRALFREPFPKLLRGNHHAEPLHDGCMARDGRRTCFVDVDPKADFYGTAEKSVMRWMNNSFSIALQVAMWMGSREIYFAGVDLHHTAGDYADGPPLTDAARSINAQLHTELLTFLRSVATRAPRIGLTLTSCSPRSLLNDFLPFEPIASALTRMACGMH